MYEGSLGFLVSTGGVIQTIKLKTGYVKLKKVLWHKKSRQLTACYKGITVNTGMKYTVKVSAHQPHSTFFQQSNVIERQNYVAVAITIASFFFYQLQLFQMWVVGQKSREEGGLNAVR